ncbi:MAG: glycosyl transferase [Firmicutes bacterium]|nr:glycosyl transferase [Bacillota bacterium]
MPIFILLIIAGILLIISLKSYKRSDEKIPGIKDVLLNSDELEEHAKELADNQMVSKDLKSNKLLISRLNNNYRIIANIYKKLNETDRQKSPASQWLLDNFYLIEEQFKETKQNLKKDKYLRLNVLKTGKLKDFPRVYEIALELISHTDGKLDSEDLIGFVKAYQTRYILSIAEIWSLSLMLRIALIEYIKNISEEIDFIHQQWEKAEETVIGNIYLKDSVNENLKTMEKINFPYIEHLLTLIRKQDTDNGEILDIIEKKATDYDLDIDKIAEQAHKEQAKFKMSMGNAILSLKDISSLNWINVYERLCVVEDILKLDPTNKYKDMDFQSKEYYRNEIEKLARKCNTTETNIARKALKLAEENKKEQRKNHIGYYIIDKGRKRLFEKFNTRPSKYILHGYPLSYYIIPIVVFTLIITGGFSFYSYNNFSSYFLSFIVGIVILIPASEFSISFINWFITHVFSPAILPKLEYKEGLPKEVSTLVVIPTLLTSKKQAKKLVKRLEVFYLANKEENIYFAIAGDYKDSDKKETNMDKEIIEKTLKEIKKLNKKYPHKHNKFYYFHRHRQFSKKQNRWMGWERKRGALIELNRLLKGFSDTSYTTISEDISILQNKIKYVITLDGDTELPLNTAKELIGTISHPLNKAVYDENKKTVTAGYGLIQPRISIDTESSNSSFFTRVFAGQGGIEPYTTAYSDVYQDLFGEGIFTGKGIFDVDIFNKVLVNKIPEDTILSHDLLEGCLIRTGLTTDIELMDGYPRKYSSYIMRLHRWVRGDWQLIKWLKSKVKNAKGDSIKNPLNSVSKWKIIDDLRRSLVPINLTLLLILGLTIFPGNTLVYVLAAIIFIGNPLILHLIDNIINKNYNLSKEKINSDIIWGFKRVIWEVLLSFTFLPHRAYMMADAILRTLYRVFISKRNLIEWTTAADIEKKLDNDLNGYFKRMKISIIIALLTIIISSVINLRNALIAIPVLALWIASPYIAYKVSKPKVSKVDKLDDSEIKLLRRLSRKTWAYYEDFASNNNNYLPPDNLQIDPPNGLANRTSPTNIGFLMISIISASDLGYITISDMVDRLNKTLTSVESLDTWRGHLYNWYDTKNLEPLRPFFVSTVDSGNFVGYLITVKQSLLEYLKKPIINKRLINGILDTINLTEDKSYKKEVKNLLEDDKYSLADFKRVLELISKDNKNGFWNIKLNNMISEFNKEFNRFFFNYDDFDIDDDLIKSKLNDIKTKISLNSLEHIYEEILTHLEDNYNNSDELNIFKNKIITSLENIKEIKNNINVLNERIYNLINNTEFKPLYDTNRQLFAIGYHVEEQKLTDSYYDLLATEARITSYLAIVRREVPKNHWFKLGRALSIVKGYRGLVSWTGTIFEYLMPGLIMKKYSNTILDETYKTVIKSQKLYGRKRKVPWGTSESGYFAFDFNFNYQYKAFGVPDLGLKRGLIDDVVVSPYSSFLALPYEPKEAIENTKSLIKEGLEGDYGLYEAIDYTPERIPFGENKGIVKSFMTHHLGMSLISINNYLNNNIMQERFHSEPMIKAGEILLQEKIPLRVIITKEYKEHVKPIENVETPDIQFKRTFDDLQYPIPRCHMLTNGRYSVLLTDGGRGFSKKDDIQITRWRDDLTEKHGSFILLRDTKNNKSWSATYEPLCKEADGQKIIFGQDKAEYIRTDDNLETHTQIVVSSEDNVEVRTVTLINHGDKESNIEVTSYNESIIANHNSDLAHPAFSNLFIRTEILQEYNTLLAGRRPREHKEKIKWALHSVVVEGESVGGLQYESNRENFIGRGRNITNPKALYEPLTNTTGIVIDPIMSLRKTVKVKPNGKVKITFITGLSDNKEDAVELAKKYQKTSSLTRAFELAYTRSQVENNYLNLDFNQIKVYQDLLSHIIFLSPMRKKYQDIISLNKKGQSSLWAYGISGDNPILLVTIDNTDDISIVKEALKAHEYLKLKGLEVDLVILNEDKSSYIQPLMDLIKDTVFQNQRSDLVDKPGGIFIRSANIMDEDDKILLYTVAKVILKGSLGGIEDQIYTDEEYNYPDIKEFKNIDFIHNGNKEREIDFSFFNGYGGFSKDYKEYIIKLKKGMYTPAPWINVVANKQFGFLVSENGSGFIWAENSRENKLTPWSNDPVSDKPGEVIYIRDEDNGDVWTMTPLPIREGEEYIITHGLGYSKFEHYSHGINQDLTMFVTKDDPVKISLVNLKNNSNVDRNLTLTYYIKPVLGVSQEDTRQFINTKVDENNTLLITNSYNDEFPNRIAFMNASENVIGFTGDSEEFTGRDGDLNNPIALKREGLSGNVGSCLDPCGAFQIKVNLKPKEEKEITFMFGQCKNKENINRLVDKYRNVSICKEELEASKNNWDEMLGRISVETPDPSMDILLNYWLMYQTISCRLWAKSAFYQSGGAYGFRDQLQDAMNTIYADSKITRDQIILHCAHQFKEGDVQHWWHKSKTTEADKGIRTRFSDDLMWLPLALTEYIIKTGDYTILDEEVNFIESEPLKEGEDEKYNIPTVSQEKASVYNHCIRAIERALKYGEHGIPLMGSGDWNDGMNKVGNLGKGESVWLGWFICLILKRFSSIAKKVNDNERAEKYLEVVDKIRENIEENAWDGSWYKRAYFDDGTPLGSAENSECMIDSLAQSWSIISGCGSYKRTIEAMESVDKHLVKEDKGLILLFTPPFDKSSLDPGYIKGYVPGVRENGGQYTHAATWVIKANAMMKNREKAWKLYNLINPVNHTRTPIECATYKVEPYVMAADVYAVSPHDGRGGWTWYTGTAGWMYKVGLEDILGFKKVDNRIYLNPCIPSDWPEYTMKYNYNDSQYIINIKNPNKIYEGIKEIKYDKKVIDKDYIELKNDNKDHNIEVILG